jgi:hypothetical protein
MAIAVPVPALILVALRDSHGAGLLVGVLLGASFVHRQTSVTPAHGAALPAL